MHDNIGAFQLAMPVVTSRAAAGPGPALDSIGAKAQATWINSRGQVIKGDDNESRTSSSASSRNARVSPGLTRRRPRMAADQSHPEALAQENADRHRHLVES